MLTFLKGKKAYIMAALIGIGGALTYLGTEIPTEAWALTVAGYMAAMRAAVDKITV